MPQLMPLFWIMYMFIFMFIVFMMKMVYSSYFFKKFSYFNNSSSLTQSQWFW